MFSVPIQYISSGIKMDPDDQITPLMKIFGPNDTKIQFELISYFGVFDTRNAPADQTAKIGATTLTPFFRLYFSTYGLKKYFYIIT